MTENQNVSGINGSKLNELLSNYKTGEIQEGTDEWCVTGKTGEKYIIEEDGNVMTAYEKAKSLVNMKSDIDYPKAVISSGSERVYSRFICNKPENYEIIDYGLLYSNNGTFNDVSQFKIENVDGTNIQIVKSYYGAKVKDNGLGTHVVGYVKVQDPYTNEFEFYTEDLGGKYSELVNNN